jgi:hypothetical protein
MRVLKLFLGKNIFLQIFLQLQIFCVKRPDNPPLGSEHVRLSRPDGKVTNPDTRGSVEC